MDEGCVYRMILFVLTLERLLILSFQGMESESIRC
jgi:hypothetical protein